MNAAEQVCQRPLQQGVQFMDPAVGKTVDIRDELDAVVQQGTATTNAWSGCDHAAELALQCPVRIAAQAAIGADEIQGSFAVAA